MRAGLYPENSAAQGQVLRLSRYRAARIGVDVNLHTGRWTFEQAVTYFMEAGGLDREAAEGEAAGAASQPVAEDHLHDRQVADHAAARAVSRRPGRRRSASARSTMSCISYGSLPLSVIEWLMFDDDASLRAALN